jgi:hypothetical protein
MLGFSFCRFFTKFCMSGIHAIPFCFVPVYKEFGSSGSSLSCYESVLCCTWLPDVECATSWHEDFAYTGFMCFRCEEDGPWHWSFELTRVIYLFLSTCFVSVALTTLLDVMTVCCWGCFQINLIVLYQHQLQQRISQKLKSISYKEIVEQKQPCKNNLTSLLINYT